MKTAGRGWSEADPRGRAGGNRFTWPVEGRVSSAFGMRNGAHHDGLDIPSRTGTPIHAAEAGRVIHSGNKLQGYGNMIIIKHAGVYTTVYAHNEKNLVEEGDFVDKGQIIGKVGDTGRASTPHLHFEIRRDGRAQDPVGYLP